MSMKIGNNSPMYQCKKCKICIPECILIVEVAMVITALVAGNSFRTKSKYLTYLKQTNIGIWNTCVWNSFLMIISNLVLDELQTTLTACHCQSLSVLL